MDGDSLPTDMVFLSFSRRFSHVLTRKHLEVKQRQAPVTELKDSLLYVTESYV